jgi:predicted amino acid-binding ACT domain protein
MKITIDLENVSKILFDDLLEIEILKEHKNEEKTVVAALRSSVEDTLKNETKKEDYEQIVAESIARDLNRMSEVANTERDLRGKTEGFGDDK